MVLDKVLHRCPSFDAGATFVSNKCGADVRTAEFAFDEERNR